MNTFQILLISLITGLSYLTRRACGDMQLERPIVLGPLTGLILGDFATGLQLGATLELIFMGAQAIGGAVPSNTAIGSTVGTAIAIASGTGVEGGTAVAVATAVACSSFETLAKTFCSFFAHWADNYAAKGNWRGINLAVWLGNLLHFLADFLPTFLALSIGAEALTALMANIPANVMAGINGMGKLLTALGFGLLLNNLGTKKLMPYFFIGFALAAYIPAFGTMGIAFIGVAYAILYAYQHSKEAE